MKSWMFPIETLGEFSEYRERYVFKTNDGDGYLVFLLGATIDGDTVTLIGHFDRGGRVYQIFDGRSYRHAGDIDNPQLGKALALYRAAATGGVIEYVMRSKRLCALHLRAQAYMRGVPCDGSFLQS